MKISNYTEIDTFGPICSPIACTFQWIVVMEAKAANVFVLKTNPSMPWS